MPKEELTEETRDVLSQGEALSDLVDSRGWKIAMQRMNALLRDVDSTRNIDLKKNDNELKTELMAKSMAIDIVLDWFQEVTGLASQHKDQNEEMLRRLRQGEDIIKRFD